MKTDNTEGLREYAAMMIKTMTKALEVSPYTQGPDGSELQVRFWATLAVLAQNRCSLSKAAVGGEGRLGSTGYMTRQEAAVYLRISTHQLDHLKLPRSILGARPRYSRIDLDEYLQRRKTTPAQGPPAILPDGYPQTSTVEAWQSLPKAIQDARRRGALPSSRERSVSKPSPEKAARAYQKLVEQGRHDPHAPAWRYFEHNGRFPTWASVRTYKKTGKWPREDKWATDDKMVPGAKRDRDGALYWHTRGPSVYLTAAEKAKDRTA